jgi:hypothetical protein
MVLLDHWYQMTSKCMENGIVVAYIILATLIIVATTWFVIDHGADIVSRMT